jgi:4-diphosphocytidyl-2-C-methyl-D-erythritol kinase
MADLSSTADTSRSGVISRIAPAKINLCLEIIGRREDSYHDITSVMQTVDLHDTLTFARSDGDLLTLECDNPVLAAEGEDNLVLKAARLLRTAAGLEGKVGAHITLQKRIPLSAGLGGGSSDAAATLLGLRDLWGLEMRSGDLLELAETLGSDVPFFLGGPTALVEGRGERVTRIPSPPPGWVVLVCPRYDLTGKTKKLYSALTSSDMSEGIVTHRLIAALVGGHFPDSSLLYNAFERVAYELFEGLDRVRQKVAHAARSDVHLSGSGPTLYVLYPASQERTASRLYDALAQDGLRVYLTSLRS